MSMANTYRNVSKEERIPPRKPFLAILIYFVIVAYLVRTEQPLLISIFLLSFVAVAHFSYLRFTIKDSF